MAGSAWPFHLLAVHKSNQNIRAIAGTYRMLFSDRTWQQVLPGLALMPITMPFPFRLSPCHAALLIWNPTTQLKTTNIKVQWLDNITQASKVSGTRSQAQSYPWKLCHSWNSGTSVRDPNPCMYEYICSKCAKVGFNWHHKVVECKGTLNRDISSSSKGILQSALQSGQVSSSPNHSHAWWQKTQWHYNISST